MLGLVLLFYNCEFSKYFHLLMLHLRFIMSSETKIVSETNRLSFKHEYDDDIESDTHFMAPNFITLSVKSWITMCFL